MASPKSGPGAPPLAALETLFGPPEIATKPRTVDDRSLDASPDSDDTLPAAAAATAGAEPKSPSGPTVWSAVRRADHAQRTEARVTVTISVTAAQRRRLKQMALDRDTSIQALLEPCVLAVLRAAERP